jgi:hypothetical protein
MGCAVKARTWRGLTWGAPDCLASRTTVPCLVTAARSASRSTGVESAILAGRRECGCNSGHVYAGQCVFEKHGMGNSAKHK